MGAPDYVQSHSKYHNAVVTKTAFKKKSQVANQKPCLAKIPTGPTHFLKSGKHQVPCWEPLISTNQLQLSTFKPHEFKDIKFPEIVRPSGEKYSSSTPSTMGQKEIWLKKKHMQYLLSY